ncbi:MAG: hypothetical protein M5U12_30460 [Verrucomicrobia bacterium]|nr:hypothetical protein [Verrucomicrobiota bacterium]
MPCAWSENRAYVTLGTPVSRYLTSPSRCRPNVSADTKSWWLRFRHRRLRQSRVCRCVRCGGIQVLDISDPANPRRAGGYETSVLARSLAVAGHYVYVAGDQSGYHVIDVTNPAAPRRVGGYSGSTFALRLAVSGDHVFVADGAIQILDVSDPAAPRRVGDDGWERRCRSRGRRGRLRPGEQCRIEVLSFAGALECRLLLLDSEADCR